MKLKRSPVVVHFLFGQFMHEFNQIPPEIVILFVKYFSIPAFALPSDSSELLHNLFHIRLLDDCGSLPI